MPGILTMTETYLPSGKRWHKYTPGMTGTISDMKVIETNTHTSYKRSPEENEGRIAILLRANDELAVYTLPGFVSGENEID